MSTVNNADLPPPVADDGENNKKKKSKRQGKGSRQKNDEKFRTRKNKEVVDAYQAGLRRKLGLLDDEDKKPLKAAIEANQIAQQSRAIPLSVTTRGVGFAVTNFYNRAVSSGSLQTMSAIASIHQIYRAGLWMAWYKLYLTQECQNEAVANSYQFEQIEVDRSFTNVLATVTRIPSVLAAVLDSIGKITTITTEKGIYHMGIPPARVELQPTTITAEYLSLIVTPETMRTILNKLPSFTTPNAVRQDLLQHNSNPGLRLSPMNILENANDIYPPDYNASNLRSDIDALNSFMDRVAFRIPLLVTKFNWSPLATAAGLWSCPRQAVSISSTFE